MYTFGMDNRIKSVKPSFIIPILLIIVLGFGIYFNSFSGKFIWDDNFLIRDNTYIKSASKLPYIFTKHIGASDEVKGGKGFHYRPLQMLTYAVEYPLWKLDPRGYHIINTLFHILAALALYRLLNILFSNKALSIFTALFFVAHPIHTEAVSYISGRADLLMALFVFLTLIFYIKSLESEKNCTLVYMSYILALLSREGSLVLPLLIFLYHYAFKKDIKFRKILPIWGITLAYIVLRFTLLRNFSFSSTHATTAFERIPGFFAAITEYIRLLFLPLNLHMIYKNRLFNFAEPKVLFGLLIFMFLLIYAVRKRNTGKIVFFGIAWFFITLLPQSNIYPIGTYMAEHWLYLPSIGFFIVLSNSLLSIKGPKFAKFTAIVFMVGFIVFYSFLTIRQNIYWKGPVTFYKRTLKYNPKSGFLYNDLGLSYYNAGNTKEAVISYKKAIALDPDYVNTYVNLGNLYASTGNNAEALIFYNKAIGINPDYPMAYCGIGLLKDNLGQRDEAISFYKKAIALEPNLRVAHNNIAITYYYMEEYDLAIKHCTKALELGYKVDPVLLEELSKYLRKE